MAKGNDFKKPVNNTETIIDEEDKNKRLIVIICLSILVVIGLIIASICYFNSNSVEDDKKNNNDDSNKPSEIIKDPVPEKPVVEEHKPDKIIVDNVGSNDNKNDNQIADNNTDNKDEEEKPEEVKPIEPIISETEDYQVTVDENGVAKLVGTSKFYTKVNDAFGEGYNNIVTVKVTLNKDYKLEDLDKLNIATKTVNGWNNYDVSVLDSTPEEKAEGNLYFYWMQAVGKGMSREPKLVITYGNGFVEEYTMDLSDLVIESLNEDESKTLVALNDENKLGDKVVVGGQEITYQMYVLENKTASEVWKEEDDSIVTTGEQTEETDNSGTLNENGDNTGDNSEKLPDTPEVKEPEAKDYTLKFGGKANYYKDGLTVSGKTIDSNYVLAIKLITPLVTDPDTGEVVIDSLTNKPKTQDVSTLTDMVLTITDQEGNETKYSYAELSNLSTIEVKDNYIYFYQIIDENGVVNPTISIDWDGEGKNYGLVTYTFDISELELEPETESNPTLPDEGNGENPGDTTSGSQNGSDNGSQSGETANGVSQENPVLDNSQNTTTDEGVL